MSESNEVGGAGEHVLRDHAAVPALMRDDGTASLELRRAVRALRALSACNQALVHASCGTDLLNSICRVIVGHAGYRLAWVGYVMNDADQSVRPVAHVGFEDGYLECAKITWAESERGRGPTGTAIRTKRAKICRHIITDPDFAPWREEALRRGFASSIVLPLMDHDEVFGVLNIYASEPDAFSDEEAALLDEMANDMAYGLLSLSAKDALRESEEMYRDVFEHVSDGLLILEQRPDGRFNPVGSNPSAIAIHGDTAPDVPEDVTEIWRHCVATGEAGHYDESRRSGERGLREFSCIVLPISRRMPTEKRILIISRDVTELKLEGRRNREARKELENVVAQRTHAWQESERRFRDVFESAPIAIWIEDWSAIIAGLVALRANQADLSDDGAKWNDTVCKLAETRTIVDANPGALEMFGCRDLGGIVGKCRSAIGMSGYAEDSAELHAGPANLSEIAESIALDLLRQDPARVVEWRIDPGLVAVGDARLLRAALENLLGNAWKFTSKQPAARIEFGAESSGGERVYFVRDNGAGFDMAYMERLFAPFCRLHSTTEFPGTGVGLATVQRIIRRHEGRIWAEVHTGQGAVFRFTLGIAPAT